MSDREQKVAVSTHRWLALAAGLTLLASIVPAAATPDTAHGAAAGGSGESSLESCPGPSSMDTTEVDQLCGTTVIRGDQSAQTRVWLPVDASIKANFGAENAQIRIEGDGDYVGFALSEAVSGRTGKTLLAYRGPGHWFGEPIASVDHKLFQFDPDEDDEIVAARSTGEAMLPAGLYDLYLIAAGDPVTVTLALPTIDGEAEIHPAGPADVRSFFGSTPSGTVTDVLASPGIFQWVAWVLDTAGPWASAHALRRDTEVAGYAAGTGRPPAFGVRHTHTFWSTPSEWGAVWSNARGPTGRHMAHGLWLGLGEVAESKTSDSAVHAGGESVAPAATAEVEHARQVGNSIAIDEGALRARPMSGAVQTTPERAR